MASFKKGKVDEQTLALLKHSKRAYVGSDKELSMLKMEVKKMEVGDYIDFDKSYSPAIREYQSRWRRANDLGIKFRVYKVSSDSMRIVRIF
jgi:hypothetical protein